MFTNVGYINDYKATFTCGAGEEPEQLLMILAGTDGTGKTYIVNVV